jgi:hypothetical protein
MLRGPVFRATAVPVLALQLLGACYRYVPTTGDVTVGGAYRGHLTQEGSQRVAPLVGENVERFDGRIITVTDTSYLVSMSATQRRADARQIVWTGERLVIPRSAVNKFETRELDRKRTMRAAILYAVAVIGVGALVFSIKGGSGGDGGQPPPPPPP